MATCEVAVHYVPIWHTEARTDAWHGKGWTAWDLVRASKPRYEGHRQPPRPEWGFLDDADPHTAVREIDLAADHGICSFLYHYYHYEDGPSVNRALDQGFLHAANLDRISFGILWDNRDVLATSPALLSCAPALVQTGVLTPAAFEALSRSLVERYFRHPSCLKVEGCPFFGIHDLVNFVKSHGSLEAAREALESLQLKAAMAGLPGLHIHGVLCDLHDTARWAPFGGPAAVVKALALDSVAAASFLEHFDIRTDTFPRGSYGKAAAANFHHWETDFRSWGAAYVPNVTVGFDASPRCCPTDHFERREYPFLPVLDGNTPAAVRSAFEHAKAHIARPDTKVKMITISSWNDWLNGAAMLPDEAHGICFLEMLKRVMVREIVPTRSPGASQAPRTGVVSTKSPVSPAPRPAGSH